MITSNILEHRKQVAERIAKGIESFDLLEKARSGRYADTAENRRLNRVGQEYGSKKQDDDSKDKDKKSKQDSSSKEKSKFDPKAPLAQLSKEQAYEAINEVLGTDFKVGSIEELEDDAMRKELTPEDIKSLGEAESGEGEDDWTKPDFLGESDQQLLQSFKSAMDKGDYKQAMSSVKLMETIVREEIPLELYDQLVINQPNEYNERAVNQARERIKNRGSEEGGGEAIEINEESLATLADDGYAHQKIGDYITTEDPFADESVDSEDVADHFDMDEDDVDGEYKAEYLGYQLTNDLESMQEMIEDYPGLEGVVKELLKDKATEKDSNKDSKQFSFDQFKFGSELSEYLDDQDMSELESIATDLNIDISDTSDKDDIKTLILNAYDES